MLQSPRVTVAVAIRFTNQCIKGLFQQSQKLFKRRCICVANDVLPIAFCPSIILAHLFVGQRKYGGNCQRAVGATCLGRTFASSQLLHASVSVEALTQLRQHLHRDEIDAPAPLPLLSLYFLAWFNLLYSLNVEIFLILRSTVYVFVLRYANARSGDRDVM